MLYEKLDIMYRSAVSSNTIANEQMELGPSPQRACRLSMWWRV